MTLSRPASTCLVGLLLGLCSSLGSQEQRLGRSELERQHEKVRAAFADVVRDVIPATVRVRVDGERVSLGTVVDASGLVVTKASVLGEGAVTCDLADGRRHDAVRLGVDDRSDLALLGLPVSSVTAAAWSGDAPPEAGSWVATVGQSALPLVVGLVTVEPREFTSLRRQDRNRGFLGVRLEDAGGSRGARITEVIDESAAAAAGLERDDIVMRAGKREVESADDLIAAIGRKKAGDEVDLAYRRGEAKRSTRVKLRRAPASSRRRGEDRWGGGPFSERRFGFPAVLAHDSPVRPRDCGGPLVDLDGRVVGINISRALRVATYALPAAAVRETVDRLLEDAHPARLARSRRIEPRGIAGTVLVSSTETPALVEAFANLLPAASAGRVLVLGPEAPSALVRLAASGHVEALETVDPGEPGRLQDARAVWVTDKAIAADALDTVGPALRSVVESGGLVAVLGASAASCGTAFRHGDSVVAGVGLVPGSALGCGEEAAASVAVLLEDEPGLVGYTVGSGVTAVFRGRRVGAIGGDLSIDLAAGPGREARELVLEPRRGLADLTALRRAARARSGPAPVPGPAVVEEGSLVVVGGGALTSEIVERFIELAGGPESTIVVFPTAIPDPIPERLGIVEIFEDHGARRVEVLRGRTIEEVESPEFLATINRAGGLWFGGGRQWRFVDAYAGTRAHAAMRGVLERGGVIGGSSAGASIQASYLARGNPLGNRDIMAEGYERGLGFLSGVAVDQHFAQRDRFADMSALVRAYPRLLGIGVDEATALVVRGRIGTVIGRHSVHFYDAGRKIEPGTADYLSVRAGGSYNLADRRRRASF